MDRARTRIGRSVSRELEAIGDGHEHVTEAVNALPRFVCRLIGGRIDGMRRAIIGRELAAETANALPRF